MYSLNTPDRRHSDSIKWQRYANQDIIPMWVADMDFAAAPEIIAALQARVAHGVFGYGEVLPSVNEAVVLGLARDHAWHIREEWLVWLPGVVTGLNLACQIAGEPGDEVLTLAPVYPAFFSAPGLQQRVSVRSDLVLRDGRWQCDWDEIAARISPRTKMLMLCHPHNPVGRVFDESELRRFAALAEQHDLLICSDDIHCNLVLDEAHPYRPIAMLDESVAARCITLMAPSKTWNIPGLSSAFAVISDARLRARFKQAMQGIVPHVNVLGLVATEAAYRHGDAWRQAVLTVLRKNAQRVAEVVSSIPGISTTPVEATYLAWLDTRELDLAQPAKFFEAAGVGLSDGAPFGAPGFVRLNFGCNEALLEAALTRMQVAVAAL